VTNGFLDDVELRQIKSFEQALLRYMKDTQPGLLQEIQTGARLDQAKTEALNQAIRDFKSTAAY